MIKIPTDFGYPLDFPDIGIKYGDTVLNPDRPLTGKFQDYLTGTYPSWEMIVPRGTWVGVDLAIGPDRTEYFLRMKDKFYTGGFRKECEEIDNVED